MAWLPSDTSLPYLSWQRRRCTPHGRYGPPGPARPPAPHRSWGTTALRGHLPAPQWLSWSPCPACRQAGGAGAGFFPCPLVASWQVMRGHSCPLSQNLEGAGQSTLATGTAPPDHLRPRHLWGNPAPREPPMPTEHTPGRGRSCAALARMGSWFRPRAVSVCGAGPGQERPWLT